MHSSRSRLTFLMIALSGIATLTACSGESDRPPALITSGDAGGIFDTGAIQQTPCDPPSENCPCADMEAGTQLYCGVIYRQSGDHVDCAKGYMTCLDTGKWGPCEGPRVYTANPE